MKLPRARWWSAALLSAAVAAFVVWRVRQPGDLEQRLARYRAAGQPVTLAELDASYAAVPESENAAPLLLEAISGWRSVTDTNLPLSNPGTWYPRRGMPWPAPLLAAARAELASNAVPLAALHAALSRPRSRYPVDLRVNSSGPSLVVSKVAQKLYLESGCAAETGDAARATAALLASFKAARTLEDVPVFLSHAERLSVNGIATECAEKVLSRISLTGPQLEQLQQAFVLAEAPGHFGRAAVGDRCQTLHCFSMPSAQLLPSVLDTSVGPASDPSVWEKIAQTCLWNIYGNIYDLSGLKGLDRRYCLGRMDELIGLAAQPRVDWPKWQKTSSSGLQDQGQQRSRFLRPISSMTLPNYGTWIGTELRSVTTLRCAQTALAVERWRSAHGDALPPSLEALVPQFIAAVPIDLMDGKPLKFRASAKGYVVYSVGEDGFDDGGLSRFERGPDPKDKNQRSDRWDYTFTVAR